MSSFLDDCRNRGEILLYRGRWSSIENRGVGRGETPNRNFANGNGGSKRNLDRRVADIVPKHRG